METRNLAWQTQLSTTNIHKQVGKIVIPAFSIETAPLNKCMAFNYPYLGNGNIIKEESGNLPNLANAGGFTFEGWFKFLPQISFDTADGYTYSIAYYGSANIGGDAAVVFQIKRVGGKYYMHFFARDAAAGEHNLVGLTPLSVNKWTHLRWSWISSGLYMYVDGVIEATSTALLSMIALSATHEFNVNTIVESTGDSYIPFLAAEVKLYTVGLDPALIRHRFVPATLDMFPELIAYYKCNNISGVYPLIKTHDEVSNSEIAVFNAWEDFALIDDRFPYKRGGSTPVAEISVTVDKNCAFRAPIKKPTRDCNFSLVFRKINEDDTITRYYLWPMANIFIPRATRYTGQQLGTSFIIEVWNVDGEQSVDLTSDFTIYTQSRRIVTTVDYVQINADDTVAVNTDIYQQFPMTFPATFLSPRPTY